MLLYIKENKKNAEKYFRKRKKTQGSTKTSKQIIYGKGEAEKSVQELEMQRLQMQKQKDEIRQQVLFFKIRYWICPKNEMIVAYKNIEKKRINVCMKSLKNRKKYVS